MINCIISKLRIWRRYASNWMLGLIDLSPILGLWRDQGNTPTKSIRGTYIYMAIRRPNKPPEAGTDVFAIDTGNSSSTTQHVGTVDSLLILQL